MVSYFFKGACLLFVLTIQAAGGAAPLEVMGLLLLVASYVFREKYANHILLLAAEALLVFLLSFASPVYLALYGVTVFDLATRGLLWAALLPVAAGFYFLSGALPAAFLFLLALSSCAGHLVRLLREKESSFHQTYDRERQIRYDLERAKARLLDAARASAHLAEIRERNRIAGEIHDGIGHSLSGNLLRLQAADRLLDKDPAKARDLLQQSVAGLAGSVDLLRHTVYNIKPREQLGWAYFEKIIENFQFCPVQFQHHGDINGLPPDHIEILSSILKEALTNAARHSGADRVEVNLEIRERIARLYIRDNGRGCAQIREGIGISGMKERVRNAGGHITITPDEGFRIVCVLPREAAEEGGGCIETAENPGS